MKEILIAVGGVILFLGALIALAVVRSFRRTRALSILAQQLGLTFTEEYGMRLAIPSCAKGEKPRAQHVMEENISGLRVMIFDYLFDVEQGFGDEKQTVTRTWTMAAFSSPKHSLPTFSLEKKRFISLTSDRVVLEGYPEFATRFSLAGKDKEAVSALFNPQLIGFLLSTNPNAKWSLEGSGSWVVFNRGSGLPLKSWTTFLQETSQAAAGFFQNAASGEPARVASAS